MFPTLTIPPHGPADTPRRDESPMPQALWCRGLDGLSLYIVGQDNTASRLFTICDIGPTADKWARGEIPHPGPNNSCKITQSTKQATHERVQT